MSDRFTSREELRTRRLTDTFVERTPPASNARSTYEPDVLQTAILEALEDDRVREVYLQCCTQWGKTEIILTVIYHVVMHAPAKIFFVLPDRDARDLFHRNRLAPMMRANADFAARCHFGPDDAIPGDSTLLFDGGALTYGYTGSGPKMRSVDAAWIIGDECSQFRTGREGASAIALALNRSDSHGEDYKAIFVSSPTTDDNPHHLRFLNGDACVVETPCGACGAWYDLSGDEYVVRGLRIVCPHCGHEPDRAERVKQRELRRFRATNDDAEAGIRSFLVPRIADPEFPEELLRKRYESDVVNFYNSYLAQTYSPPKIEALEEKHVRLLADVAVPRGRRVWRTIGADTQADRIEYEVLDWHGQACLLRGHWQVPRDEVDAVPLKGFAAHLVEWRPDMVFIDRTGRHRAGEFRALAHKYLRRWERTKKIRYIQGQSRGVGSPMIAGKTQGMGPLYLQLNSDECKAELHRLMSSQSISLMDADLTAIDGLEGYARQVLTERAVLRRNARGEDVEVWDKPFSRRPNEALDTGGYGVAAHEYLEMTRKPVNTALAGAQ